jgi:methyl-accepting chemotaxis protein
VRLAHRFWIVVAVAVVAVAGIAIASVEALDQTLARERRAKVRALVDEIDEVLSAYQRLVAAGTLTRAEAERAVIQLVHSLPAQDGQYFWITDLHPRVVAHGASPALEGADASAVDPFPAIVEAARADPAGRFVEYRWPRPQGEIAVRKVSFVKHNRAWGWIVGSGLYLDDVEAAAAAHRHGMLGVVAAIAILLALAGALVERSTRHAAESLEREAVAHERARVAEELAESERGRLEAERLAEIGRLAAGLAHEVNSPLAVVKSNLSWLRDAGAVRREPHEWPLAISEALDSTERIARIVANLGGNSVLTREPRPVPPADAEEEPREEVV